MKLLIVHSNSAGNCYLLEASNGDVLMVECGVNIKKIKQALNFKVHKVVGCLVSHEHLDHCSAVDDVLEAGITVCATRGTHNAMGTTGHYMARTVKKLESFALGSFKIKPFDVKHDAAEPVGFMIDHPECGLVLFITDTFYVPYKFTGINNIIVEANYCEDILRKRLENGANKYVRDRVIQSHLSIQTCKELLLANDLSLVNNIVLIHLSDANSDAKKFQKEVTELTGKRVHVAEAGMVIDLFNKTPF